MDLICYLHPGWAPLIRPAPRTRAWMDATPQSFAYRCLPLDIANAHGWEVLNPVGFEAVWDGGAGVEAVTIRPDEGVQAERAAASLFGQGVLTFHVEGVFRTAPGWNLWVSGSPNRQKDAIQPLTGVVETDWSPFTFTMNWRFTRPHTPVRFEALEPFCFLFPVERDALEAIEPRFAPMAKEPGLEARFRGWSAGRDAFQARMRSEPDVAAADRWQKHYYQGTDGMGSAAPPGHRTKLRLRPFDRHATPDAPEAPADDRAADPPDPPSASALAKREWLLETLERQRDLSPTAAGIERREGLDADEFLERYYAANRPVILTGEIADWPALTLWTPDYLRARIGDRTVAFQGGREGDRDFETDKDRHRQRAAFSDFLDAIARPGAGNDAYITAYNAAENVQAFADLAADVRPIEAFLDPAAEGADGMMWIGPAGTFTPLHHDLTNNFIVQVVGRKRVVLAPPSETGRLYNSRHVFSDVRDLEDPALDFGRFPRLAGARAYGVDLEAGEILFMPLAWWHQVRALSFSVTITYTNFRWPNDAWRSFPQA